MSNRKPLLSTIVDNKDLAPKGKCKANNSRYQCQKAKANAVNDTGTLDSTPFPYFVHSLTVWRMFENSRELIPLHIYLRFAWHWPLTSWPQKLIVSCPYPVEHLRQVAPQSVNSLSRYHVHKFCNGQMNGRTHEQATNTVPLPASLARQKRKRQ